MYQCSLENMTEKIQTFSTFGATGNGGITRYSLSKEAVMAREEFEKFISKSVEILAEDEMKMNIHKDKMLWYNTKYCIRTSDERS